MTTQVIAKTSDPYSMVVCNFFQTRFPGTIHSEGTQLLDILTSILVGDKNARYGPRPSPEQLVAVRKVITKAIEEARPIPILVAWGGRKTDQAFGIDVAEVAAIDQLLKLDEAVRKYYPHGTYTNIRIEDTGAWWLYRHDTPAHVIEGYSMQMEDLVSILGKGAIFGIRESDLMNEDRYFDLSRQMSELLHPLIMARMVDPTIDLESRPEMVVLKEDYGWAGGVPMDQVSHYMGRYEVLYPEKTATDRVKMLADYLGGSRARYILKGRAAPDVLSDGSYIGISLVPPIPGSPAGLFSTTLYWRSIPQTMGRTHIAPWRAKGYLEIDENSEVKVKLSSWGNKDVLDTLNTLEVTLEWSGKSVTIQTDYLLAGGDDN